MNEKCPFCEMVSDDLLQHVWDWHVRPVGYSAKTCWCGAPFARRQGPYGWEVHIRLAGGLVPHYLEDALKLT